MFSPMFLENKLKFSPYIKEAVVFGDQRDFIGVLINIDPIVVGKWAEGRGISFTTFMDLSSKKEVAELMKRQVAEFNQTVEKPHFQIRRFAILHKLLDVDDGELTKTGKIRRQFVREKYAELYDALYSEEVSEASMETRFQYRDGQTTSVQSTIQLFTME
jgi:long-chain acyl-CoA synthetase